MMKDDEAPSTETNYDGGARAEFAYERDDVKSEPSEVDPTPVDEIDDGVGEELSDQDVRPEVVGRVINVLRADAERMEGKLQREDLQRQCFRRNLTIAECIRVESLLSEDGISIHSNDDPESEESGAESSKPRSPFSNMAKFLTDSEERELGRKIQLALRTHAEDPQSPKEYVQRLQKESIAAKERFVQSTVRYVRKIAIRYASRRHMSEEDLFQEGVLGLLRATDTYDPEMGFRFSTYATWWITQRIRRAIDDFDRTIRLPVHVSDKIRAAKRASRRLTAESGQEPSLDQVAEVIGIETERLARLMWSAAESECLDGDAPATPDMENSGTSLFSLLRDSQASSQFDLAFREELKLMIKEKLSAKQAEVLLQRFGFGDKGELTLEEVGRRLGLTRERVRQIQDNALGKLGRILKGMILKKRKKDDRGLPS